MFRLKLSKFKQVLAVAIIPRVLVRDTRPVKNKLNYTLEVFNKIRKSTESGSKDDGNEKQRQIIEKCFGANDPDVKLQQESEIEQRPENEHVRLAGDEKYKSKAIDGELSVGGQASAEEATLQATTASVQEETLAQKLEKIDETPHVEASPEGVEGFNSAPRVMGHDVELFANEKIQQIDLDDLAKRCVGAPIGNIDELLIKEMKNMSIRNSKSQPDMNLIRSHCVEKYYSEIFDNLKEREITKVEDVDKQDGNEHSENKTVQDEKLKFERITPLHTDSIHLFAIDEGSYDFTETGFVRADSMSLITDMKDPFYDVPNVITPYDSPGMPFYEYVNKEPVVLDDFYETGTVADDFAYSKTETNIPQTEEVLKKDTEETANETEIPQMDPLTAGPTLSHTAEPLAGSAIETNKRQIYQRSDAFVKLAQSELLKSLYVNANSKKAKKNDSRVLSTPTDYGHYEPSMNPSSNPTMSRNMEQQEMLSKDDPQGYEKHEDTAISAHQNPGEYYDIRSLNYPIKFLDDPFPTLTAETHTIHSTFCMYPQGKNDGFQIETDDMIQELGYPTVLRDPFSYTLAEPEPIYHCCAQHLLGQEAPQKCCAEQLSVEEPAVKCSAENVNEKIVAATLQKLTVSPEADSTKTDDGIPLSQILQRIRHRSRVEFCRNLLMQCAKANPKKLACPPPADRHKPKNPYQSKRKQKKCETKKDPRAKLIPFFLSTIIRSDVSINIPLPIKQYNICKYKTMLTEEIVERLQNLGERLQFVKVDRDIHFMKDAACARDFEPWIPIPSWPVPKVEKKRPFVCPKEGCKQFPEPRPNPPKQKPCLGMPKKRFSFTTVNMPELLIN